MTGTLERNATRRDRRGFITAMCACLYLSLIRTLHPVIGKGYCNDEYNNDDFYILATAAVAGELS